LLVDSDWENPTVTFFRSTFGAPYFFDVHIGPVAPASATRCCPAPDLLLPPEPLLEESLLELLAQPPAARTLATAAQVTTARRVDRRRG
jgi:hypothetical protein